MVNLSKYKLNSMQEFKDLTKIPGFLEYAMPIYNYLETMAPGAVLRLNAPDDKIEWLVKTVCYFIASGNHGLEYELNENYTKIRRSTIPGNYKHK